MVMAVAIHAGKSGSQDVYHVGSSCKNPITFGQLHDLAARYFTKSPLVGRDGSPIIVSKGTILSTMSQFSFYMTLRYKLPLQMLRLINIVYPWWNGNKYKDIDRKINLAMRLVDLYRPYVLFKGIFDDMNTERMRLKRQDINNQIYGSLEFDPKSIDWEDYITNIHIPGLITYVLQNWSFYAIISFILYCGRSELRAYYKFQFVIYDIYVINLFIILLICYIMLIIYFYYNCNR